MTQEHLAVAARAAWVEHDDVVYAALLPDGPPLVLAGPSGVIWRALCAGGTLGEVSVRVADEVGSPVEVVAADVAAFVDGLVAAGLVARTGGAVEPAPAPAGD